jgi:hypothetical protein
VDVPEDFYTKYSWAVSSDADLVHGATGTNNALGVASPEEKGRSVGVFLIQPSHEYLNGGARALSLVGWGGGGEREGAWSTTVGDVDADADVTLLRGRSIAC